MGRIEEDECVFRMGRRGDSSGRAGQREVGKVGTFLKRGRTPPTVCNLHVRRGNKKRSARVDVHTPSLISWRFWTCLFSRRGASAALTNRTADGDSGRRWLLTIFPIEAWPQIRPPGPNPTHYGRISAPRKSRFTQTRARSPNLAGCQSRGAGRGVEADGISGSWMFFGEIRTVG
jgi:hypothetical protein